MESVLCNKIQLDAHLRKLVDVAILSLFVETKLFLIIRCIVLDLDVTVILDATPDCWLDGGGAFDLAKAVRWGQSSGDRGQEVINMGWTSERPSGSWFFGQGSVETVKMPIEPAVGTGNDRTIRR
jgi:hypothetical protein